MLSNKTVLNFKPRIDLSCFKFSTSTVIFLPFLFLIAFKTKDFSNVLDSLEVNNTKLTMIVGDNDNNLYLSCRNLNNIRLVSAKHVSTYDIINSNMLLFDKTGVEFLNENL